MTTKQLLLSVLILGVTTNIAIQCMETKHIIEADIKNMLAICEKQCSFTKDVTQNCTSNCFMDYGKQKENFLIRKYTHACSELPFSEKWSFKTDVKSQLIDEMNTIDAFYQWQNHAIAHCAKNYMSRHKQIMDQLEQEKMHEIAHIQSSHLVLSTGVDVYNWMRRGRK